MKKILLFLFIILSLSCFSAANTEEVRLGTFTPWSSIFNEPISTGRYRIKYKASNHIYTKTDAAGELYEDVENHIVMWSLDSQFVDDITNGQETNRDNELTLREINGGYAKVHVDDILVTKIEFIDNTEGDGNYYWKSEIEFVFEVEIKDLDVKRTNTTDVDFEDGTDCKPNGGQHLKDGKASFTRYEDGSGMSNGGVLPIFKLIGFDVYGNSIPGFLYNGLEVELYIEVDLGKTKPPITLTIDDNTIDMGTVPYGERLDSTDDTKNTDSAEIDIKASHESIVFIEMGATDTKGETISEFNVSNSGDDIACRTYLSIKGTNGELDGLSKSMDSGGIEIGDNWLDEKATLIMSGTANSSVGSVEEDSINTTLLVDSKSIDAVDDSVSAGEYKGSFYLRFSYEE